MIRVIRPMMSSLAAGVVTACLTTGALAQQGAGAGPPQGPPNGMGVQILNVPVPITGSATVSGTVAATQSGPWTVQVVNPASAPAAVSVNNTADFAKALGVGQPFDTFLTCSFGVKSGFNFLDDGQLNVCMTGVNVPANKQMTIEFASFDCGATVGGPQQLFDATVFAKAGTVIPSATTGPVPHVLLVQGLLGSQSVRIYGDPQTPVIVRLSTTVANPVVGCGISLSGRVVDVP